nr:endo alpha-1,4 polygalactosaminidase [Nocardia bovistercoris]
MLVACTSSEEDEATDSVPTTVSSISPLLWKSGAETPFDYQLGDPYTPPGGVGLVVRDSSAEPVPGIYNICYVNGFQTQPSDREYWLRMRRDLVLDGPDGEPVIDDDWPDELLLDTSTSDERTRLSEVVGKAIDECARKGFRAVEIDNLDSFTRSRGRLSADDNLDFAALLVRRAHDRGLAIGQKNVAELSTRGKRTGFDFAVAEQCVQFDECGSYVEVYGAYVLDIEYSDTLGTPFERACARPGTPAATILRDRQLTPAGHRNHVYEHC